MIIANRQTHEIIYAEPFTQEQTDAFWVKVVELAAHALLDKLIQEQEGESNEGTAKP